MPRVRDIPGALFLAAPVVFFALLAPGAPAQTTLLLLAGEGAGDGLGASVGILGDLDQDGLDDILAGAPDDDDAGASSGSLFVVSAASGMKLLHLVGGQAGDRLGIGSGPAGDVNGDGWPDLAASAPEADVGGAASAGRVRIVSGADGSTLHLATGDSPADLFGFSSAAGDVNGDGFPDVLVGAPFDDDPGKVNAGSVIVLSGLDGAVLLRLVGLNANDQLGHAVASGDVDGDGHADVVAGAPMADPGGSASGQAIAFSGASGTILLVVNGAQAFDHLGESVAAGSDVDLDGSDEVIAGVPDSDLAFADAGEVRVVSGATGAVLFTFTGGAAQDRLGASVAAAGDVDGDGYGDLAAGAPGDDTAASGAGSVRFFSGRDGREAYALFGTFSGDAFGSTVAVGGDADGDGFSDLIAGAPLDDDNGANSGSARAVSLVPIGVQHFGTGTPGCKGPQKLNANGVAFPGAMDYALFSFRAPKNMPGVMLVGDTPDPTGNDFLQIQALLHIAFPPVGSFVAGAPSQSDGKGSVVFPLPIPNDASLSGVTAVVQHISVWPFDCPGLGSLRASTSVAMSVTVQ